MNILCDTNVIMNYLTGRNDPFLKSSEKVIELCSRKSLHGYIAFHSLSTIWYVLRKLYSSEDSRYLLSKTCGILTVSAASHSQIVEAIKNSAFQDFEDCLQDECAQKIGADYLVTCNIRDFKYAKTPVVTPDQMLSILEETS